MSESLQSQEYRLRLAVNRLRREMYTEIAPNELVAHLAALEETERTLSGVQKQLTEGIPGGLILDSKQKTALLGAETTGIEVEVSLKMAHVPTGIYHLLQPQEQPLITCKVTNTTNDNKAKRVRVVAFIEGYSAQAIETFELKAKKSYSFALLPTLFPERIQALHELTRATLNLLVQDLDGRDELQKTEPIWLLARNSAPLSIKDPATNAWRDVTQYYGAFVTPNEPSVMAFLRKVAAQHPQGRLEGYHRVAEDPQSVTGQIEAIYQALKQDAGIAYVDSIIANNPDEGASSQRVRLPRQSLTEGQANCIDATVLFASLIEALSMNPAIVIVPYHALLAWEKKPASDEWDYLETTKIATLTFADACKFGRTLAEAYLKQKGQTGDERFFRRWSLHELRTHHHITPME